MTEVTIAAEIFPPAVGGPATYAAAVADHLRNRGILRAVVFYQAGPSGVDGDISWVSSSLGKPERAIEYTRTLKKIASGSLIFAQGMVASGLPALWASRYLGVPLVVRCPGDYSWEVSRRQEIIDGPAYEEYTKPITKQLASLFRLQIKVLSEAQALIVPCAFMKEVLTNWGLPERKISIIRNAPHVPPGYEPLRASERDLRFLVVGRMTSWKGTSRIIRAFAAACQSMHGAVLTVVGEGPCAQEVQHLVDILGLGGRIELRRFLPRSETLNLLRHSFALVVNSGYECTSNVVTEALAVGTPVISCTTPGIHELLIDRRSVLLFPRDDQRTLARCMLELWSSRLLWDDLHSNSLVIARQYNFYDMLEATIDTLSGW